MVRSTGILILCMACAVQDFYDTPMHISYTLPGHGNIRDRLVESLLRQSAGDDADWGTTPSIHRCHCGEAGIDSSHWQFRVTMTR